MLGPHLKDSVGGLRSPKPRVRDQVQNQQDKGQHMKAQTETTGSTSLLINTAAQAAGRGLKHSALLRKLFPLVGAAALLVRLTRSQRGTATGPEAGHQPDGAPRGPREVPTGSRRRGVAPRGRRVTKGGAAS